MFNSIKKIFGIPSKEVKKLMDEGALIIDVRTPFEFKGGHIPGSGNIPLDTLSSKIAELKKLNKTIVTVCRSGARSVTAKNILTSAGLNACNGGSWTNFNA